MSRERLTSYQAQEKRICFIEKAVGEGTLRKIPTSERNQDIAITYLLNEKMTAREIRENFPKPSGELLTKQQVSGTWKRFLQRLYENSSPQLQSSHPLQELFIRKPNALGEANARIKKSILEEGVSLPNIRKAEGVHAFTNTRHVFRRRGIEIPPEHISYQDFKAKVEKETDYGELKKLLKKANLRHIVNMQSKEDADARPLSSLSSILYKGNFYHFHKYIESSFMKKIEAAGIPIISLDVAKNKSRYPQKYWIVYSKHKDVIIDALKDDPDLQQFRQNSIQLICGNSDKMPTTIYFFKKNSGQFGSNMAELIRDCMGITIGGKSRIRTEHVLIGCPVPVFKVNSGYAYPKDRIEDLKAFLRSKKLDGIRSAA